LRTIDLEVVVTDNQSVPISLWRRAVSRSAMVVLLIAAGLVIASPRSADAWDNGTASTPPMGWNSYDSYNWNVTEAQVKANTDYMRNNLRQHGWQYIVIDWGWYRPGSGTGSPGQDANLQPRLRMDANGRLLPDTTRFPSAGGSNGFRPLADYVHAAGLKIGVHLMRGIPRQAVADNVPIAGSTATANQINNTTTASWLNLMWGLNMSNPGAQAYLDSVFQLYASWGVDFVKVDDIAAPTYRQAEIDGYHLAIQRSGRPMVLSLSPGPTPHTWRPTPTCGASSTTCGTTGRPWTPCSTSCATGHRTDRPAPGPTRT
jgi:alpha-galactosidase